MIRRRIAEMTCLVPRSEAGLVAYVRSTTVWISGIVSFLVGPAVAEDSAELFLNALRRYADQGLAQGRDTYGKPTPLFVDGVVVGTGEAVTWKWKDERPWVICNVATQQGWFRTLDGITTLTGDPRYKAAALDALQYAFRHLRFGNAREGGLLAWGGHLAYNATDDMLAGNPDGSGRVHELKCHFPHYGLMWEADPEATREIIENTWNSHVLDWATLDFNRHGVPRAIGKLWASEFRGGKIHFEGDGLTFHNAGSDFYFAAGMLSRLSGLPSPLTWATRLSQRYADTRNPITDLEGFQFSQSASAWCDSSGKIRGDRARHQFAGEFEGHLVVEGTLFPCYGDTPLVETQMGRLLLAEALGKDGGIFLEHAVRALSGWGKSAYRESDNRFLPMLTDGTPLEGYVIRKDGYFGPKGMVFRAGKPDIDHLHAYAFAYRLSREPFLWEMTRKLARRGGWGEIGDPAEPAERNLSASAERSDPRLILTWLDLYRATGDPVFLRQATAIGRNLLAQRTHNGWFVESRRHVHCRLANDESQAILHLAAALMGKAGSVPAFTGAHPFFHAEYGKSEKRVYDSIEIYGKTR